MLLPSDVAPQVRPSFVEASVQRRATSSVAHHLLVNYQRAHIAIIKAQFTTKRLRDGMEVRAAQPDLLCYMSSTDNGLSIGFLVQLLRVCTFILPYATAGPPVWGCLLQGVLAVAEACGMQNLLKAAGVEYQVHGLHVAVTAQGNSAYCATQATRRCDSSPPTAPCCCLQDLRKLRRLTSSGTALLAGLSSSGKVAIPAHGCTTAQLLPVQQRQSCVPADLMTLPPVRNVRAVEPGCVLEQSQSRWAGSLTVDAQWLQKHMRKLSSHAFSLNFDVKEVAAAITQGAAGCATSADHACWHITFWPAVCVCPLLSCGCWMAAWTCRRGGRGRGHFQQGRRRAG
jgi:hypothetical protein